MFYSQGGRGNNYIGVNSRGRTTITYNIKLTLYKIEATESEPTGVIIKYMCNQPNIHQIFTKQIYNIT